jgi:O-antigen/teichoic acid export membrane protein
MTDDSKRDKMTRHVLLSSVSNYIGRFINIAIWFVLTPFILNELGAETYGLWALVGSVVAYAYLLDFGIANAVTKYVAEYRARGEGEKAHSIIATALCINLGLGFLVILMSALLAPFFTDLFNVAPSDQQTATWLFFLAGAGVGLTIPGAMVTAVLRGLQRFDLMNLVGVMATFLSAGGTFLVLRLGGGVLGLALVGIGVSIVVQLLSIFFVYRIAPELKFGWLVLSRSNMKILVSYSSSLFLMNLGGYLESRSDEIVIGGFLPVSEVTPYNLARRLSTLPQTFTEQFLSLILPMASEIHAREDASQLRSLYLISTRITLLTCLPISMILIVLGKPILTAWVGAEYGAYSYLVVILVTATLIDTSQWPAGFILQGMARHSPLAIMTIASGVSNLILSILLVTRLGLMGVALGTLVPTTIICLGFVTPYAMRVIGVPVKDIYLKVLHPTLLPVIPMMLVMAALREWIHPVSFVWIIVIATLGSMVYLAIYLLMGGNDFEKKILRKVYLQIITLGKSHSKASERSS